MHKEQFKESMVPFFSLRNKDIRVRFQVAKNKLVQKYNEATKQSESYRQEKCVKKKKTQMS